MRKVHATLAAACLILTVAACDHKPAPLSQQEKQIVTELTANLKTRCVGRYLIDMPAEADESGYAKIQGVSIDAKAMTEAAWRQEVAQREAALKATKSRDAYPFLYEAGKARGEHTYYFIHRGTIYEAPNRRYIEGYKWDRGYRFLLKVKTYDYTNPDRSGDPIVEQFDVKNGVPEKAAVVFGLLEKLRGRSPDDIPTEPGLCFAGGFLPGKASDGQYVRGGFGLASKPDVFFKVAVDTAFQGDTSLLQRFQPLNSQIKEAGGTVIRKGTVVLEIGKAEELLIAGLTPARVPGHSFSLEVNSTSSSAQAPFLSLDMRNGGLNLDPRDGKKIDKASLTEGEAIGLWDAVSRTLRLRPGAM
ncbi:T6SS immunity protein Tli4 family protein [Burkholderia glumae]|uniref:T6SS immunity protein Tli4 family protein n=1 Tax=Burkholderia glumae TaxID=337 RepID=UPI001374DEA6|nr:T6SS immunity protein Tli4 family protein [Burkholderia glumae]UVS98251.1 hypothetical protein EFP19_21140 [Burkholderia glumae]